MHILELFRRLSFGELSNLAISGEPAGSGLIIKDKQPQIVQYANEGLLRLFSRFQLKQSELVIEQSQAITFYHLQRKFAVTADSDAEVSYIKDTADDPFVDDVIRILSVHGPSGGTKKLNDIEDPDSLFTPQPDVLQIPKPVAGELLNVVYQARHPVLDARPGHIIKQEIFIPFFMEGALQAFIGYKVYSHMNGQENVIKSQEYMATYETICSDIEQRDLVNQTYHTSHHKLEQRGFV